MRDSHPCPARRTAGLALLALLAGGTATALAQTVPRAGAPPAAGPASQAPAAALPLAPAPTAPPAAPPRPERTTASYGDWVLRCELPPGGERSCEVAQTVQDARGQTLAQLVARRAGPNGAVLLSVQVGANATVTEPLRLAVEGQAPLLLLPFRRCLPRGCFAEAQPPEAELGPLLRRTEPARLEFTDGDGQPVAIPASLRGLAASLDALRTADRG